MPAHSKLLCQTVAALVFAFTSMCAGPAAAIDVQVMKSPGGIEAWLVENHTSPLIAATIIFKGGQVQDPASKPGLAHFANCMFNEGAADLKTNELMQRLHIDLGASFSKAAADETHTFTLRVLTENRDAALDIVGMMFQQPRFDGDAMQRCRDEIGVQIDGAENDSGSQLSLTVSRMLNPNHPFSKPVYGTKAALAEFTREDVLDYRRRVLAKNNMKIAVVGDIDAATLGPLLDRTFGALPEQASLDPTPPLPEPVSEAKVLEFDVPQASISLSSNITLATDQDRAAADVILQAVGSGSLESYLMMELREKRGLVYAVSAGRAGTTLGDRLYGWIQTGNDKAAEAIAVYRDVMRRVLRDGIAEEDVARAKSVLKGSTLIGSRFSQSIASTLAGNQYWGKGPTHFKNYGNRIDAVTMDDIRRVAPLILRPDELTIVAAGKGVKL